VRMLISMAACVRRIGSLLRARRARPDFACGAVVGTGFSCGPTAGCTNGSGIQANIRIGDRVAILGRLTPRAKGRIRLGNYVTIRARSGIGAAESIEIGDYVIISSDVLIYGNNNHPTSPSRRKEILESGFYSPLWQWNNSRKAPIRIASHVWIGQRAAILKGVSIGEGSIVGMGAVVTRDVPPYSIAVGNPARCLPLDLEAPEKGPSSGHPTAAAGMRRSANDHPAQRWEGERRH
jgi:acetyltransferase-like isoleucine patch superfamily enzyme